MSEAAAVAAPVESAPVVAVPATDAGAGQPTTATAAREQLFQRPALPATAAEAQQALNLPPRNAEGQFTTESAAVTETPAESVAEAVPAAVPAAAPEATPAATVVPDGFIRLDVPEGHPLRDRGLSEVLVSKDMEDYHRWALQNPVRRDQVVQWQTYANQWKDRAIAAEARASALQVVGDTVLVDPKTQHMISDIESTYGKEAAEAFKRGLIDPKIEAKTKEARDAFVASEALNEAQAVATRFANTAYATAVKEFPLFTPAEFDHALATYGALMEATGVEVPDLNAFRRHAAGTYLQKPEVQSQLAAQQKRQTDAELEKARKAERDLLLKQEADRLAAARDRRLEIPMAGVPSTVATAATLGVQTGAQTVGAARDALFRRGMRR